MKLTDRATKKLERYLADVRRLASPSDADDIIQNLREHVAIEASQSEAPLNASRLDEVLERLGEPEIYSGSGEFAPEWLGFLSMGLGVIGLCIVWFEIGLIPGALLILLGGLIALYAEFDPRLDRALSPYGRATGLCLTMTLLILPPALIWGQSQQGGILQDRVNNIEGAGFFFSTALGLIMLATTLMWSVVCYLSWDRMAIAKRIAPRKTIIWFAFAISLFLLVAMCVGAVL